MGYIYLGEYYHKTGKELKNGFQKLKTLNLNVLSGRLWHLTQIMTGEGTGHAYGDPRGAIEQQIGYTGGKNNGFPQCTIVIGTELHSFFFKVVENV